MNLSQPSSNLTALLDKNFLYVNLPDLDAPEMGFDETTRRFNRSFYVAG
jgi:hypothetical protein